MKFLSIIVVLIVICSASSNAQKDPAAEPYLNKFSDKALNAPSVRMIFDIIITDQIENTTETRAGEIIIKDDLYKLVLPENIIWYNGDAIWTLAPEVDEVTITEPDPDGETFFSSPSTLFTLYKEGYKYRLISENNSEITIDLYPENLMAEFSLIKLLIGKNHDLIMAEYKRKDGINMVIRVKEYDLNSSFENTFFTFDKTKYKNVDIIDMR